MTNRPEPRPDAGSAGARMALALSALAVFALFAFIVVPGLRQPGLARGAPESTSDSTGWLDPAEAPARRGRDIAPVDPSTVMLPRPDLLARGRELYRQNCTSCHGEAGRGDGPAARGLAPAPRDFTRKEGWTRGYRMTDIFETLASGIGGTGMAAFDYLDAADRMALVHYVRSLGAFDHGAEDGALLDQLAARFRSAGGRQPNRIPVSLAIARLEKEASPPALLVLPEDPAFPSQLRDLVWDKERAARTIAGLRDRDRVETLAPVLAAGAPANGFRTEVAKLGAGQWQALHLALLRAGRDPERR